MFCSRVWSIKTQVQLLLTVTPSTTFRSIPTRACRYMRGFGNLLDRSHRGSYRIDISKAIVHWPLYFSMMFKPHIWTCCAGIACAVHSRAFSGDVGRQCTSHVRSYILIVFQNKNTGVALWWHEFHAVRRFQLTSSEGFCEICLCFIALQLAFHFIMSDCDKFVCVIGMDVYVAWRCCGITHDFAMIMLWHHHKVYR